MTRRHEFVPDHVPTAGPCLSGCMVRGRHLDDCEGPCEEDCARRCVEHCRGCQPRGAFLDSRVCLPCKGRVLRALGALPPLVAWIRMHDVPAGTIDLEPRIGGSRVPPVPLRLDAVDAADELHAMLASWCRLVVEEHPAGFAGPDLRGSVMSRAVLADPTGAVVGLGVAHVPRAAAGRRFEVREVLAEGPVAARSTRYVDRLGHHGSWPGDDWLVTVPATERAAAWLLTHLDWALSQLWADEFVREVTETVATVEHRWPVTERPARLPTACPACGRASLVRHAPSWPEAPVTILCEASGCGELIPERLYEFHAARVLADNRAGVRDDEATEGGAA